MGNKLQVGTPASGGLCFPALTLKHIWLAVPVFLLVLKAFLFPLPLLDFWWHLKLGQIILHTKTIPRVDLFSFTAAGKPFIVQNWLAEIIFYSVYRAGGFALLIFLNAVLLVLTLLPVYLLCRQSSEKLWAGVSAACLVSVCIVCNLRPQVFSFLLFAIYYWLLSDYYAGKRSRIWFLPILMVLWVNLHGAFLLGLGLAGIFLAGEGIESLLERTQRDAIGARPLAELALVFLFCWIATLANPETYHVYSYLYTVIQDPSSQQLVIEWQPPVISTAPGFFQFYLPFFLTTLVLMLAGRRPSLTHLLLYVGFSAFGLTASRNSVWFLLVSAPILARYLPSVHLPSIRVYRLDSPRVLPGSVPIQPRRVQGRQYTLLNLAIAGAALVIIGVQSPWVQQRANRNSLFESKTPVAAMDYIEAHPLAGNIFHPQIYGDYLIWRLWPRQRSFFDGRVHLFGEPFVRLYQRVYSDTHWEELLKGRGIRYLLLCKQDEKADNTNLIDSARRSRHWKLLYEDAQAILLEDVSDEMPGVRGLSSSSTIAK